MLQQPIRLSLRKFDNELHRVPPDDILVVLGAGGLGGEREKDGCVEGCTRNA